MPGSKACCRPQGPDPGQRRGKSRGQAGSWRAPIKNIAGHYAMFGCGRGLGIPLLAGQSGEVICHSPLVGKTVFTCELFSLERLGKPEMQDRSMRSRNRLRVQDDMNENGTLHPIALPLPAYRLKPPTPRARAHWRPSSSPVAAWGWFCHAQSDCPDIDAFLISAQSLSARPFD